MNRFTLLAFALLFLTACGTVPAGESPLATQQLAPSTPSITATPTVDEVKTAQAVIQFAEATGTAAAAFTSTSVAVTSTQEAKATAAFWVGLTFDGFTQQAQQTHAAEETQRPPTQTALAATQIIAQDQLESKRISTWVWTLGKAIAGVSALWVLVYGAFFGIKYLQGRGEADVNKRTQIKPDERGRFPLVPEKALGNQRLVNPNLMHRATLDARATDTLTNTEALENTRDQRKLEMVREVAASPAIKSLASSLMKRAETPAPTAGNVTISKIDPPLLTESDAAALPVPHWKLLNKWDGRFLPFGADEKENLMLVDPTKHPHLMVVGGTGSGKTRSSIRTIVAGALTTGWNVVVMGKQVDYLPFADHPNATIIAVDVRKDSRRYISILRQLTAQMDTRDRLLSAAKVSTWDRYGAPQTMIVLDDFSGAMLRMPKDDAKEVLAEAKQIAMDGRKFGLNLAIGLQRATWTSIDSDLRSQMGRIVYRVESALDSRVALDESGAERLPYLNFLTKLTDDSSLQRGVGFFMEDLEVESFLKSRPVKENEKVDWVEGVVVPETAPLKLIDKDGAPISVDLQKAYETAEKEIALEDKIASEWLACRERRLWEGWNQLERKIHDGTLRNGSYQIKIKSVVANIEGVTPDKINDVIAAYVASWRTTTLPTTTATTTAKPAGMGDFQPIPQ